MRNKGLFLLLLFVMIFNAISFSACKKKTKEPEEIIDYLKNLKSYECRVDMYVKNDRQELKYEMKQYCDASMGYRLEIGNGRVQIYKDGKIHVDDVKNNAKYELDENFDEVFKISFVGEYIKLLYYSSDIKFSELAVDKDKYVLLELGLPGTNRNMEKAVMYIDTKSYYPSKVLIYNNKDKETVNITYRDFKADLDIDKKLFFVD
jgi:outer membrane lipoprotein-sorting protein